MQRGSASTSSGSSSSPSSNSKGSPSTKRSNNRSSTSGTTTSSAIGSSSVVSLSSSSTKANETGSIGVSGKELCSYLHRICLQNRLDGYDYCIRHILVDKSAPFKQCSYVHQVSGKRCPNAARRSDRSHGSSNSSSNNNGTLCPWHLKRLCLKRKSHEIQTSFNRNQKGASGAGKKRSFGSLLKDLEHYCHNETHDKKRRNIDWIKNHDDEMITTASDELRIKISEAAAELNYHHDNSDSANFTDDDNSNNNNPLIEETLRNDILDSDSESIDSNHEDPLKHAGIYTPEEVSLILSEKMHRLQTLYIEQFKHLKYVLREKHRKFMMASVNPSDATPHNTHPKHSTAHNHNENISLSSIDPMTIDPEDEEKFRAMRKYHKYRGKEALLKIQAKEKRRAITEGKNYQPLQHPKCIFIKGSDKCDNRSLPSTHYCVKHILYDVNQVLFRPCASGIPPCLNPVVSYQHKNSCILHEDLKTDTAQAVKLTGKSDGEGTSGGAECTSMGHSNAEPDMFQTMDDIASLALDAVEPTSLFGLDQFGDLGSASDLLHQNM